MNFEMKKALLLMALSLVGISIGFCLLVFGGMSR